MAVLGHRWLAGAYMAAGGGVAGGKGGEIGSRSVRGAAAVTRPAGRQVGTTNDVGVCGGRTEVGGKGAWK